jgi:DNA (cytosine-5)-methyltransferase 1
VWAAIDEVLERNGYTVFHGKLHAEQFGVPQTRTRAFLIARLDAQVRWPVPTHSRFHLREPGRLDSGVKPWVSMAEALGWGMTHRPSMTVTGGGSDTGGSEPFGNAARQGMSREIEADRWREKPEWCFNRPSTTIVSSFRPDIVAAPGYRKAGDGPRQNAPGSVRISVDEAALLQSFPVSYPWQGTKGKQFQQIGNAVPPLLAKAVLAEVLR